MTVSQSLLVSDDIVGLGSTGQIPCRISLSLGFSRVFPDWTGVDGVLRGRPQKRSDIPVTLYEGDMPYPS